MGLSRLEPSHLADRAYQELRGAILEGHLPAGSRLVEAQLAEQLGVSRLPVREALIQLEADGLAVRQRGRGTFVPSLSADDVREVYSLRAALEALAFRLAREHLSDENIQSLQALINKMEQAAAAGNVTKLSALEVEFHGLIVRLSGHRRVLSVWNSMIVQIQLLSVRVIDTLYADLEIVPERHRKLLDALVNGDGARELENHIMSVADRVQELRALDALKSPKVRVSRSGR
jgi:DNA-binding GntR family transcriptional regulator